MSDVSNNFAPKFHSQHPKIIQRRKKLLKSLNNSVAILPSGSVNPDGNNIVTTFQSYADFFYYSGLEDSDTIAIFTNVHPEHHYILFWKEVDANYQIWHGPKLTCSQIKEKTGADAVYPYETFSSKILEYLKGAEILYYPSGYEDNLFTTINKIRSEELKKLSIPQKIPRQIYDFDLLSQDVRSKKDQDEIKLIKSAVDITTNAFLAIISRDWEDSYEYEIEGELHFFYRMYGAINSFSPIVASGPNSTILHYNKNDRHIEPKDILLIDSGASYGHYCADVTRTFPASKEFNKYQRMVYEAVLHAQKCAIKAIKPGNKVADFHLTAVKELVEALKKMGILQGDTNEIIEKQEYKAYYPHSTGHWLGLDVHDRLGTYYNGNMPRYFHPGMVCTVEPGLYFPIENIKIPKHFQGIGIRIEDDILVTKNGCEVLTKYIPKEIEDLEDIVGIRF